ncbi:hypothetical protein H2204_002726 [Knufia peltigerae]|uniref:L-lactate dehydrogenase (cytochrome) n=1 Tax=Knufia peltigerae TaxID=1002370 RepID=A0AA38YAT4_9EURO|nr:hypothetical protein H2204_002726 [Knufia peltigerae]
MAFSSSKTIKASEIQQHNKVDDIWIVVNGRVYDMTRFAPEHPGGVEIIYSYAGRDASQAYNEIHERNLIRANLRPEEILGDLDPTTSFPEASTTSSGSAVPPKEGEKPPLETLLNLNDFEEAAQHSISKKSWAFISGASNDNITRDANKNFYQKIWFRPRILKNVAKVSTKASMMGCNVSLPLWISPTGIGKAGGPEGEIALSKAASETGIIQTISTNASFPLEEILSAAPGQPFFFQLYINKDRTKTKELLRTVNNKPQIKALFVTVDLPVVSKREADERIKHEQFLSSGLSGSYSSSDNKGSGLARSVGSFIDPSFEWNDLAWLRNKTKLPIVLKGIQSAADARLAMHMGCQGVVVSNHGGRALDGAPAAIVVLLELHKECPEVFDYMQVFIDGGIRRGSDILKAVCLGASGVGIGRSFLYALNYGKPGVVHLINILKDEVATAMRLCGLKSLDEADPGFVNTAELDVLVARGFGHPYARKHTMKRRPYHL